MNKDVVDFMPLEKDIIDEVLKTGQYRGIDVVDNTLDIIKDKDILKKIMDSSIIL